MKQSAKERKEALVAMIGLEIVHFQDATNTIDEAAAAALGLPRGALPVLSALLYGGAATAAKLAEPGAEPARIARDRLRRLELAGYTRRTRGPGGELVELTEHARQWVATIWGPLAREGQRVLGAESLASLGALARVFAAIRPVQESHAARIRTLSEPGAPKNRLRGGLSPAALRRVQLFVLAHLAKPIRLADLASRAGLSAFHFSRAFKATMGTTPGAYLQSVRIEHAARLLRETSSPLARIASDTGLGSQSRFTTAFRRHTGLTPAVYRRGD